MKYISLLSITIACLVTQAAYAAETELDRENIHSFGSKKPVVTVIEYADFECPFCQRHSDTMTELYKKYPSKVRFVFRHYPLPFHSYAEMYAVSAECVAKQNKDFFVYKANLMSALQTDKEYTTARSLLPIARKSRIQTNKFLSCMKKSDMRTINAHMRSGIEKGVQGTPTVFIEYDGISMPITGAQPIETYTKVLDSLLKK